MEQTILELGSCQYWHAIFRLNGVLYDINQGSTKISPSLIVSSYGKFVRDDGLYGIHVIFRYTYGLHTDCEYKFNSRDNYKVSRIPDSEIEKIIRRSLGEPVAVVEACKYKYSPVESYVFKIDFPLKEFFFSGIFLSEGVLFLMFRFIIFLV